MLGCIFQQIRRTKIAQLQKNQPFSVEKEAAIFCSKTRTPNLIYFFSLFKQIQIFIHEHGSFSPVELDRGWHNDMLLHFH